MPIGQDLVQLRRRLDIGHIQSVGLLGGFCGDNHQPIFAKPLGIGAFGQDRPNLCSPQFCGFFHDRLHPTTFDHRDQQDQIRTEPLRPLQTHCLQNHKALAHLINPAPPLAVCSIEHQQLIAHGFAHHLGQIATLPVI